MTTLLLTRLIILSIFVYFQPVYSQTDSYIENDTVIKVKNVNLQNNEDEITINDITITITENELQKSIFEKIEQIYVLSNSTNEKCRIASYEYLTALKNYEIWALKMLDASSKLPSGIVGGNLADFGSYTQCVHITKGGSDQNINGKHCLLAVLPPENIIKKMLLSRGIAQKTYSIVRNVFLNKPFEWSICIPDACQPEDVFNHFEHTVNELFEGLNASLQSDIRCSTWADVDLSYSSTEKFVLSLIIILMVVAVISTVVDVYKRKMDADQGFEVIFSLVANSRWLIAKRNSFENLASLDGVRVLSICMVIIGHRFLMSIFFASFNGFALSEWILKYFSQIVIGGTVSVDSFLLISGVLLSYHFLQSQERGQKFNYFSYLLHHYLRLAPSFGFMIMLIVVFGHRFGMGPKWEPSCSGVMQPCKDFWWSALLNIQSYVNPKSVCLLQTWYLSIDMANYAFAPLLIFPLMKNPSLGFAILAMVLLTVWVVNFIQVMTKKWVVVALLDQNLPTTTFFVEHYTQPHIRPAPYIIGIALGYFLYKYRYTKVRMNTASLAIGWTLSFTLIVTVILANLIFLDPNHAYNAPEVATYIALHRSAWALALGWIVWACATGYGGPINTFLGSHTFMVFAKLTYSAFLIHMPFQFFQHGAAKLPNYFSNVSLLHNGLGDIGVSFILGYLLTLFVECPTYRLSSFFFRGRKKDTPIKVKPRIETILANRDIKYE